MEQKTMKRCLECLDCKKVRGRKDVLNLHSVSDLINLH